MRSLILAALLLPLASCSDRLLRENVLASTQTVVGLQLAQNPQTQGYEARAGFARQELFIVPTSKRVAYDSRGEVPPRVRTFAADGTPIRDEHAATGDDPSRTPEVLGEIMVDGAVGLDPAGKPLNVGVYQRLAVGPRAVASPAAERLLSRNIAGSVAPATLTDPARAELRESLRPRVEQFLARSANLQIRVGERWLSPLEAQDAWATHAAGEPTTFAQLWAARPELIPAALAPWAEALADAARTRPAQ
jgi:hypothetical protein